MINQIPRIRISFLSVGILMASSSLLSGCGSEEEPVKEVKKVAPKKVAPKPPVGVSRAQSGSAGGAGPASRARCHPSEPSERPRRNNGSRRSSESKLPDAARTHAKAAPKFGEGGGARGFREPNELAGDGVAIGGAGGGCSVAFLNVFSGDGKPTDPAPAGPIHSPEDFRRRHPDGRMGSHPSLATAQHGSSLLETAATALSEDLRSFLSDP